MKHPKVVTIGLDGPNRVGKGTQCQMLNDWFDSHNLSSLIVRGAGSRTGLGNQPGDPISPWWQEVNQWLRTPQATPQDWDITSARLARELIVWRDRVLPNCAKQMDSPIAILIIDRTLISRTMTLRARQATEIANNLYPAKAFGRRRPITAEMVCPDIIFNLTAPVSYLLARLSPSDPKYAFRKNLIDSTAAWFFDAADYIPVQLQKRVVHVDGSMPVDTVFQEIKSALQTRFPEING